MVWGWKQLRSSIDRWLESKEAKRFGEILKSPEQRTQLLEHASPGTKQLMTAMQEFVCADSPKVEFWLKDGDLIPGSSTEISPIKKDASPMWFKLILEHSTFLGHGSDFDEFVITFATKEGDINIYCGVCPLPDLRGLGIKDTLERLANHMRAKPSLILSKSPLS